jgi:hypothetical protein
VAVRRRATVDDGGSDRPARDVPSPGGSPCALTSWPTTSVEQRFGHASLRGPPPSPRVPMPVIVGLPGGGQMGATRRHPDRTCAGARARLSRPKRPTRSAFEPRGRLVVTRLRPRPPCDALLPTPTGHAALPAREGYTSISTYESCRVWYRDRPVEQLPREDPRVRYAFGSALHRASRSSSESGSRAPTEADELRVTSAHHPGHPGAHR